MTGNACIKKKYEAFGEDKDKAFYWKQADELSDFDEFLKGLIWWQVWDQECESPVAYKE